MSIKDSDLEHEDVQHLQHPRRRMSDQKIEAIANSAHLKVLQYVVTVVMIPVMAYFGANLLDEIKDIKRQVGIYSIDKATLELRLNNVEKQLTEVNSLSRVLSEEVLRLKIEQQAIKERNKGPNP